ncbi:Ribonuclease H-like superfamily protein [Rhynchospora pubera]|uniref:Ribonuclease H-like superfamily protein n=1 Tax=Rhynchospora pubera TaxID=906938 RepID=A0AAV8DV47_9POAL|nr:Ribonuclease H-like superfamily protein [Rhynchospora pubera]
MKCGGLGVKDIQNFGEALFLKIVWSLMADEDKLWVKICKTKYFPAVGYWRARNSAGASRMWRQVMARRDVFKEHVKWKIGDGKVVQAISQPWFQSWRVHENASARDRKLKVCELIDEHTGQWNMQRLQSLFQPDQIVDILNEDNKPEAQGMAKDRLVWHVAKNGKYSVKEGYKMMINRQLNVQTTHDFLWPMIWKCKNIAPRVKIFLWRLLKKGLPTGGNMHSRLPNFSPMCQRCHEENEFETHCLFFCHTSRQVWFGGQLGIRVHDLPLDINQAVQEIVSRLDEEGIRIFAYTLWKIWKERNKTVIERGNFQVQGVLKRICALLRPEVNQIQLIPTRIQCVDKYEVHKEGWQVILDASWETSGKIGTAYVVYQKGQLQSIGMHSAEVGDVFQAETLALSQAIDYVYTVMNIPTDTRIQFFSDCLNLVMAVNNGDSEDIPSWRATREVRRIIAAMELCNVGATLHHARREAVIQAHNLANSARREGLNLRGRVHWAMQQQRSINREIDNHYF